MAMATELPTSNAAPAANLSGREVINISLKICNQPGTRLYFINRTLLTVIANLVNARKSLVNET
jgi:hypothetical protein